MLAKLVLRDNYQINFKLENKNKKDFKNRIKQQQKKIIQQRNVIRVNCYD